MQQHQLFGAGGADFSNQIMHNSYQLGINFGSNTPLEYQHAPLLQAAQPMRAYLHSQAVPRRG